MSNYWLITTSPENFKVDKETSGFTVQGLKARHKKTVMKFQPGDKFQSFTVSQVRKSFHKETGLGPEGVQLLTITHKYLQDLMNEKKIPLMALADYDVAPYGFNDFFDAAQMFCSEDILGLGIGNVDQNYPLFGIPTLILHYNRETSNSIWGFLKKDLNCLLTHGH